MKRSINRHRIPSIGNEKICNDRKLLLYLENYFWGINVTLDTEVSHKNVNRKQRALYNKCVIL